MIEIKDKLKCSGCSACDNICPVDAIEMKPDEEGFLYPHVNRKKCIDCGKCDNVCPYVQGCYPDDDLEYCIAAYNKNEEERGVSSSGGMFILLAKEVIKDGGVVFGAAFDEDWNVHHTSSDTVEGLYRLVGSKYVQSQIGKIYLEVKEILDQGRTVLFAGCSCQIAGLRAFLNQNYSNLLCVDLICLGVPSPQIWNDFLDLYFDRSKIKYINFKDKNLGWNKFSVRIDSTDDEYLVEGKLVPYMTGYFRSLYSRPSCSDCRFKKGNKHSDITIADCWGYDYIAPELHDNRGISCMIVHNEIGLSYLERIKPYLAWKKANIEDIRVHNKNYCTPETLGRYRDDFWRDYILLSKEEVFYRYCTKGKEIGTP